VDLFVDKLERMYYHATREAVSDVYPRLKQFRESLGLTQTEFGKSVGIAKSTYNNYETGIREPKSDFWIAVAQKYNVTIDYLMGFSSSPLPISENQALPCSSEAMQLAQDYDGLDDHGKKVVRVVLDEEKSRMEVEAEKQRQAKAEMRRKAAQAKTDMEVAEEDDPGSDNVIWLKFNNQKASAGRGFELDYESTEPWKVRLNEWTRKADFCVEVEGSSMEPKFSDGDIILVCAQPAVDDGDIGLFTVDDRGYVKKKGPDRLISINPDYEDIYPQDYEEVRCFGKVLGVLDPDWIVER